MNEVREPDLLSELHLAIGGVYCSYKLSEEAWNLWLKMLHSQVEVSA